MAADMGAGRPLPSGPARRRSTAPLLSRPSLDSTSGDSDETLPPPMMVRRKPRFEESCSRVSSRSSEEFDDPGQNIIFLDWDDTLFPSTDLFDRWGVSRTGTASDLSEGRQRGLKNWCESVYQFLSVACTLSDRVVIVTNARIGWVEECVIRFAPSLKGLLEDPLGPRVVYAVHLLEEHTRQRRYRSSGLRPVWHAQACTQDSCMDEYLMDAKYVAMKQQVKQFYSQYPGQTWKNVTSIGDMHYEHDAAQELAFRRRAPKGERLRVKTLVTPGGPSVSELALSLQFSRLVLPLCVRLDGDADINLRATTDPLQAFSQCLKVPALGKVAFPLHAWGLGREPESCGVVDALVEVAAVVQEAILA